MKRVDWLERLWETIEAHRPLPFDWSAKPGTVNCCSFPAACVDAMTGSRHLEEMRKHCHDEASVADYIARSGGLKALVSSYLGEPKRLAFMGRGDVAIVVRLEIEFVGVCVGDTVISAGPYGLIRNPHTYATVAWSP